MKIDLDENTAYIKLEVTADSNLHVSYGYNLPAESFTDAESDEAYASASLISALAGLVGMTQQNLESVMDIGDVMVANGDFSQGVATDSEDADSAMQLLMTPSVGEIQ